MKKIKHNKKRNTGFLYEALVRELTRAVLEKNDPRKTNIVLMLKEYFSDENILAKELNLYRAMENLHELDPISAEKILFEAKQKYFQLDKKKIFKEQSNLINKINRMLSADVFSNFVPNYKNLATIAQIFNDDVPLQKRVLLESSLIKKEEQESKAEMAPISNLVLKTFTSKFNDKYNGELLEEQKSLLNKYITSFSDNGIELKVYLNEEIGRLKSELNKSLEVKELAEDTEMLESTKKVLDMIGDFKKSKIDSTMLKKVLKIQDLVKEIKTNG
mgnify:CR=1 FL=1